MLKTLAMVAALLFASHAASADPVGLVMTIDPRGGEGVALRGAPPAELALYRGFAVYGGDSIRMRDKATARIELVDGSTITADARALLRVPALQPDGVWAATVNSLRALFRPDGRMAASAAARGVPECTALTPLDAPVLVPTARLVAGKPWPQFSWFGDCAPYTVTLSLDGRVVAESPGLRTRDLRWPGVAPPEGRYVLRIRGGSGAHADYALETMARRPAASTAMEANREALGRLAVADWLATQDAGAWKLEALGILDPLLARRDVVAEALALRLDPAR